MKQRMLDSGVEMFIGMLQNWLHSHPANIFDCVTVQLRQAFGLPFHVRFTNYNAISIWIVSFRLSLSIYLYIYRCKTFYHVNKHSNEFSIFMRCHYFSHSNNRFIPYFSCTHLTPLFRLKRAHQWNFYAITVSITNSTSHE